MLLTRCRPIAASLSIALILASCGSSGGATPDASAAGTNESTATATDTGADDATTPTVAAGSDAAAATEGVDLALFFDGALAEDAAVEDCTLNGGTETTCYRITVAGYPASHEIGPFCPDTITAGADAGGIWFNGDGVYDLDGEFIVNLSTLYGDEAWHMYDDDGNVLVTETAEEFEAAEATEGGGATFILILAGSGGRPG